MLDNDLLVELKAIVAATFIGIVLTGSFLGVLDIIQLFVEILVLLDILIDFFRISKIDQFNVVVIV